MCFPSVTEKKSTIILSMSILSPKISVKIKLPMVDLKLSLPNKSSTSSYFEALKKASVSQQPQLAKYALIKINHMHRC